MGERGEFLASCMCAVFLLCTTQRCAGQGISMAAWRYMADGEGAWLAACAPSFCCAVCSAFGARLPCVSVCLPPGRSVIGKQSHINLYMKQVHLACYV